MNQEHKCPHCQNLLEFEKDAEDDGDRTYDIWKCTDRECSLIVFPFYIHFCNKKI